MRLTEYGRTPQQRKAYVQQAARLLVGVDVSKAKHHACMGTPRGISCRKLALAHTREGCQLFEPTLRTHLDKNHGQRLLIAMEPSGSSWQALYARLKDYGYGVCLVHCQAVRNNRKTIPHGTSKTAEKAADSIFDVLQQGKVFWPVARAAALQAASRLMQRPMALKKRVSQRRNPRRAALHLALPALHRLVKDLTHPTAVRFLQAHPPPASLLRNGRPRCLETWQPRPRCGPWRPATFHRLSDLAQASRGLQTPSRLDECESTTLGGDVVDALTKPQRWLDKAIARLAQRGDSHLLVPRPRSGTPTAAAIRTAIGARHAYHHGQQRVKLAGLAIR
jgi:Transposase